MKVNAPHPSFISFLDQITKNILTMVSVDNYFTLTPEKKLNTQYFVFKLMKNSVRLRAIPTKNDLKHLITILWKKHEESENYEFASILNDIKNNFDGIMEFTTTKKRQNNPKIEIKR